MPIVSIFRDTVAGLGEPEDAVETRGSWILRYRRDVLKIRKPLDPALRSPDARRERCLVEAAANGLLAPGVYVGARPIGRDDAGRLRLDAPEPEDWVVHMRRIPDDAFLHRRIAAVDGRIDHEELERGLGPLIAHLARAQPVRVSPHDHVAALYRRIAAAARGPVRGGMGIGDLLRRWLNRNRLVIQLRVAEGRVVDGHGALRPERVALTDRPAVIARRWSKTERVRDAVDDLAVLALGLERCGAPAAAAWVLEAWSAAADDGPEDGLLAFYQVLGALERAATEPDWREAAEARAPRLAAPGRTVSRPPPP